MTITINRAKTQIVSNFGTQRYAAVNVEGDKWVIYDHISGDDMTYYVTESFARSMARTMNTTRGWWTELEG
jgi:hypothetical protein